VFDERATHAVFVAGNQAPYLLTRLDELRLSWTDVPALTITADPANSVALAGSDSRDWSLRFCAQGEGDTEDEARELLQRISMVRIGGTLSLVGPHLLGSNQTRHLRGQLVVDARQMHQLWSMPRTQPSKFAM